METRISVHAFIWEGIPPETWGESGEVGQGKRKPHGHCELLSIPGKWDSIQHIPQKYCTEEWGSWSISPPTSTPHWWRVAPGAWTLWLLGLCHVWAQHAPWPRREMPNAYGVYRNVCRGPLGRAEGLWVEYQWRLLHYASPFSIARGLEEFERERKPKSDWSSFFSLFECVWVPPYPLYSLPTRITILGQLHPVAPRQAGVVFAGVTWSDIYFSRVTLEISLETSRPVRQCEWWQWLGLGRQWEVVGFWIHFGDGIDGTYKLDWVKGMRTKSNYGGP